MVRGRAETPLVQSDVGAVGVTSATIKHSKQIGLRVTFSHIFLKWNTRFCPSTYIPPPVTRGAIGDHFESVIENLRLSLRWTRYLRRTEGNLTPVIVRCITIIKGTPFLTIKSKIVVWSESPPLIKCIMCYIELFVDLVVRLEMKNRMEMWRIRAALWGHFCSSCRQEDIFH